MKSSEFLHDQSGATAIEYGLIASFIALTIAASLLVLGPKINEPLETVTDSLKYQNN